MKNKNKSKFFGLILAQFLIIFLGFFLFPNIAYFSNLNDETIINLSNQERQKLNIPALNANQYLAQAAHLKADAIIESQSFSHTIGDNSFSHWVKQTGYDYDIIGENLAIDFISSEGVIKGWMNSPDHKKNLLEPRFKEIGVAVKEGMINGEKSIIVVQILGSPKISISLNKIKTDSLPYDSEPIISQEKKPAYVNFKLRPLVSNFISANLKNSLLEKGLAGKNDLLLYVNYFILSILILELFIVGVFIIKKQ